MQAHINGGKRGMPDLFSCIAVVAVYKYSKIFAYAILKASSIVPL